MMKYKIVKLPGASPDLVEIALNKRAEEGFTVEFVDNGWFVMSQWDYDEDEDTDQVKNKDENEDVE